MAERQYSDEEAARIFERASTADRTTLPAAAAETSGMSLAALQEIGREVGISAESIAEAARSLELAGRPVSREFLGLPIGVGLTVEFDRPLTDADWERLVADLRETFDARGVVRYDGPFRQWTNGNLQALVEPTAKGHRVRLKTMRQQSRNMMAGGLGALVAAAALFATGNPGAAGGVGFLATVGLGMFGFGALSLPGWARQRRTQMEQVIARLTVASKSTPPAESSS